MFHRCRSIEVAYDLLLVRLPTWVHLRCAELELRAAPAGHLSDALRAAREANLDRLARYRRALAYPSSPAGTRGLSPCFRDGRGTLCAVAHLMHETGAADVAGEIAAFENLARVADMRTPALAGWVAESGFTVEEVARIQPQYGPYLHDYEAYSRLAATVAGVGVAALWTIVLNVSSVVWVRTSRVSSAVAGILLGAVLYLLAADAQRPNPNMGWHYHDHPDWGVHAMALGAAAVVFGLRRLYGIFAGGRAG